MWRPVSEEELLLYVDGRLPHAREGAVETHLDANPRDALRIEAYCRQATLLRALGHAIAAELPRAGEERLRGIVAAHVARMERRRRNNAVTAVCVIAVMLGVAGVEIMHASRSLPAVAGAPPRIVQESNVQPVDAVTGKEP
jgi:anti-sigma factor RsiW